MPQSSSTDTIGVIAIMVGAMLVMGGLMFVLVSLIHNVPPVVLVPPFVQIALGLAGAVAGFFLRRATERAGLLLRLLLFLAIAVIANVVFFVSAFVTTAG